tara:strand:- start:2682 stop:3182 length:501 start_codon:yes stop_codon:yes gene_type:complete
MERKLNQKANKYFTSFKDDIAKYINNLNIDDSTKNSFIQTVYEYKRFEITKLDLQKRKRIKNSVPLHERCNALRANGEQCTRRKKGCDKFCGTHTKGTPHGIVDSSKEQNNITKVKVWQQDINGIIYFLDKNFNVYDPQDVHQNIMNPKIIAKYKVKPNGDYVILN